MTSGYKAEKIKINSKLLLIIITSVSSRKDFMFVCFIYSLFKANLKEKLTVILRCSEMLKVNNN